MVVHEPAPRNRHDEVTARLGAAALHSEVRRPAVSSRRLLSRHAPAALTGNRGALLVQLSEQRNQLGRQLGLDDVGRCGTDHRTNGRQDDVVGLVGIVRKTEQAREAGPMGHDLAFRPAMPTKRKQHTQSLNRSDRPDTRRRIART